MMKIKRPDRIQIGGHWYEIVQEEGFTLRTGRWAQISFVSQTITVDKQLLSSRKTCSVGHEIIHAIAHAWLRDSLPEETIDALAEGQFQVWQQLGIEIDWDSDDKVDMV